MQRVNFLVTCLEPMEKPICRETANDSHLGSARARCDLCSGHGSLHDRLVDRVSLRSTACSGAFRVNRTFTATNDQCHTQEARGYEQKIYLAFSVPYRSRFGTPSLQTSLREQSKHFVVAPAKRKLRHAVACSEPLSDHPRRPFYRFHAPSWYGPLRHFPPGPVHPMDMYGRPSSLSLDEDRKIRPGIKGDSDFDVAMRYCERQPLAPMRVLADALEKAPDTQRIAEWPRDLLWVEYSTDHTQVHLVQPPSDPTVSKCITVLQFFTTENTDCWFGNRFWRNSMLAFREFPAIRFIRIFSGKYEAERRASGTELGAERCANESDTHPIRPDWQRIMTALERERLGGLVAIDSERLDFFRAVGAIGWPFYVVLAPTGTVLAKWYQGSPCGGPSMDEENGHILLLDIVLAGAMDYYANELCSTLPPGRFSLLPDFRKPPSFDVTPTTPTGRVFSFHREGPQTVPRSTTNELPRLRYPTKSIIVRRREPLGPTEHSETPGIQLPSRAADPATSQWHAYLVVADTNNDRIVWCRLNEARAAPQPDLHHWGTVEGLSSPRGLCYDSSRDLVYIADTGHHRICRFRIPPASERCGSSWFVAEWVAGTGVAKFDLFGSRKAREQSLAFPWDVVMGPVVPPPAPSTPLETNGAGSPANKPRSVASEALYITNAGLNQIWRVDFFAPRNESELLNPEPRSCRTVCGSGDHRQLDISVEDDQRWHIEPVRALCFVSGLAQPSGLTLVPGNREGHESGEGPFLVFVDSESSSVRFYALGSRTTHTLAGGGSASGDIDDLFEFGNRDDVDGRKARFQHPLGIAYDPLRRALYVADTYNNRIRRVDWQTGAVKTVRLMEPICSNSDSEPKLEEEKTVVQLDMRDFELRSPTGVSVDPAAFQGRGALWITESNSSRILCIEWVHGHAPGECGSLKSPCNSVKPLGRYEALEDDYEMDVKGTDGLLGQVHVVWDHSSDGIPSMVLSQSD